MIDALLRAVKAHLQEHLGLTDDQCDLTLDGKPHPRAGEEFIAIHEQGWQSISGDHDLHESFQVFVTVTRRCGVYPLDKVGSDLLYKTAQGMDKRLREIITTLHKNNADIRIAANDLLRVELGNDDFDGFITPLWFKNAQPPEFKPPAWFYSTANEESGSGVSGVARTLVFGDAEVCQTIDGMV